MLKRKIRFENGIMVALALAGVLALVLPVGKAQAAPTIEYSPTGWPGRVLITNTIPYGSFYAETFQVVCPAGTAKLVTGLIDPAPVASAKFSVSVFKSGGVHSNAGYDDIDGDTTYGAVVSVSGGTGIYSVSVAKGSFFSSPAEDYTVNMFCATAGGTVVPIPVPAAGETGSVFYLGIQ